jgi:hypothetical protein
MIVRRPLHEPYENRTAKQPNDFGEIIDNQTALRAVGPLIPPAPSPPAKALGAKGGQAVLGSSLFANISAYQRLVVEDFRAQRLEKTRGLSPVFPPFFRTFASFATWRETTLCGAGWNR